MVGHHQHGGVVVEALQQLADLVVEVLIIGADGVLVAVMRLVPRMAGVQVPPEGVLDAVKKAGITPASSSVSMVPQNYIKLEGHNANTMIRLMEALEDHDDVQNVHANFDIDQKLLEEVAG